MITPPEAKVIDRSYLECVNKVSKKFYELTMFLTGNTYTVVCEYGRIGCNNPIIQTKYQGDDKITATDCFNKIHRQKIEKGYTPTQ